jgi:hypothetical protein
VKVVGIEAVKASRAARITFAYGPEIVLDGLALRLPDRSQCRLRSNGV